MKTSPGLWIALAVLTAIFAPALARLARLALGSELHSYILIVPLISVGLIWLRRRRRGPADSLRTGPSAQPGGDTAPALPCRRLAGALVAAGGAAAAVGFLHGNLDAFILAYVLLVAGLCAWFLRRSTLAALAFPLAFLIGMVPIPDRVAGILTAASQHASAAVASFFLAAGGIPVFQPEDLILQIPGIRLEVAPQCSGLHSSLALLLTSLVAGYLLLRSPWKRIALCLAVVPIAILRNGFRIFVVGELCVRIGPRMIDSYIHRQGGWMFFLLSLVFLFALLFVLARSDRPAADPVGLART